MKLLNLILEFGEFNEKEKELDKELKAIAGEYSPYISLGAYSSDRDETDPLKNKGYGKITFVHRDDLPKDDFAKVVNWAKEKGFEIEQESNWYDYDPGERDYYPTIKLKFVVGSI